MFDLLAEDDYINEDHCIRVFGVIDHVSLMVVNNDVKSIGLEIKNLRVGIIQMLRLGRLCNQKAVTKIRVLIQ